MIEFKSLKLKERVRRPGPPSERDQSSTGQQHKPRSGAQILLIEVGEWKAGALSLLLERMGYQVQIAQEHKAGPELLERDHPKLLIVGGRANPDLYRTLRQAFAAPIFALAPWEDQGQMLDAFSAGVDDYQAGSIGSSEVVARARAIMRRVTRSPVATVVS